jgi:hypothetical protein
MSIQTSAATPIAGTRTGRSPASYCLGVLLITDALLSFAPVAILGPAIGWPASLGKPAAEQLTAIAAHADAVTLGYALYMLYSILVAPVMIGLAARTFGSLGRPLAASVAAFGALSALARCIGILRWLTVMPVLATAHGSADAASRTQLEWLFKGLSTYGGGIGEVLGVSVFMAASLGTLTIGAWVHGGMPKWLAGPGLLSALLLACLALPVLRGPALVPVAAAVTVLTVWMLAAGVWVLKKR